MALVLSGSIDISGSMTATTIVVSAPGVAGMVSSSAQITELAPLMAYTSSLKGAAIVSSSQQIKDYYTFAQTSSANTFYGNQSISGTLTATTSTTGATIKLGGFTNYGTIQDANDVRRIWFENVGSYRTIFDLPASGTSFAFRTNDGTSLFNVNSGSGASIGTGDLTITDGNVVMASGHGIDFSATSNGSGTTSSELLNDYEEGTWTPTITFGGGATSLTYNTQYGVYTKIGNVVHFSFRLILTNKGSSTGAAAIGGLPFTSANTNGNFGAVPVAFADAVVSFDKTLTWIVDPNATTINVRYCNGTNYADMNDTNFTNSSNIIASGTYRTA